jgi:hypothetical protein
MISYAIASIVLLLLFTLAIILNVGSVKPYFTVQVSDCTDSSKASYYRNDWTLSMFNAFCPINSLNHCITFDDDKSIWETIDSDNKSNGYISNLALGADEWGSAYVIVRFAYVSLYVAEIFAGVLILHSSNIIDLSKYRIHKYIQYAMLTVILLVHVYVFFTLVGVMLMLHNSDQSAAISWSTTMFDTCHVKVIKSEGFELCKYCSVVCGLLLVFSLGSIALYVFHRCIECDNETISKSTEENELRFSDVDSNPLQKVPSLRRHPSTIIMTVNPALSNKSPV